MRTLEHRRHSIRNPSGHLSQQGVTLARRIGSTIGPFEIVLTSPKARAFETAIAMGFAVDEQIDALAECSDDLADAADHGGFAAVGRLVRASHGAAAKFARAHRKALLDAIAALPDGAAALAVSHAGVVEASAAALLPDNFDLARLGAGAGYCEGVRLMFEGRECVDAEPLRAPPARSLPKL